MDTIADRDIQMDDIEPPAGDGLDVKLNVCVGVTFFVLCLLMHHYISKRFCCRQFKAYTQLPWQLQMEWDSRVVSSIHAILVTVLSMYALAFEQPLWTGKIDAPTKIGGITLSISAAYMLADAISMPIYWRNANLLVFWLHHGIAALCFSICATRGILQFFALFRLLSEMSTPFLNVNWYNRLCKVSVGSLISLANSICLSSTYLAGRLLAIPVYWYYFAQSTNTVAFGRLVAEADIVLVIWVACSLLLDILNIYWARSILRGSLATVSKGLQLRLLL